MIIIYFRLLCTIGRYQRRPSQIHRPLKRPLVVLVPLAAFRQDAIACKPEHKAGRQHASTPPNFEFIFIEVKSAPSPSSPCMLSFPHGMKKFTTLGGSLFLIWLLFSPVIAFYLFANYYDSLTAHGVNLLSLLVLSYLFFGLVGALLMRAMHQTFLVGDTVTTPQVLMFGIVYVANMFGAGLEVILKNDLFANAIIGFVIYPGLFLIGSALFAWLWERRVRSTALSAIFSVGLFAALIALDYFHIPLTWVMLCLALIKELFPARPPILTTTTGAPNIPSHN